jgi:tetratricopeptide (TPR) repeat protein
MENNENALEKQILLMMLLGKNYTSCREIYISQNIVRDIMQCFCIILYERDRYIGKFPNNNELNKLVSKVTEYIIREPPYRSHKTTFSYKFIKDVVDIILNFEMYEQFNRDIELQPTSRNEFYRKGKAYVHFGYYRCAIKCFTETINNYTDTEDKILSHSYFLRAECYYHLEITEETLKDVNIACNIEPENLDYLFLKINAEIELRNSNVINSFRKGIKILKRMKKVLEKEKSGIYKLYNVAEYRTKIGSKEGSIIISPSYIKDKLSELKRLFSVMNIYRKSLI